WKVQYVICTRVGRKPVAPINLLAPGFKDWEPLFAFWNTLATYLYDLEILLVYPNTSLKEAFALLFRHYLRFNIEHEGIQLVNVFIPGVGEVVLADFSRFDHRRFSA